MAFVVLLLSLEDGFGMAFVVLLLSLEDGFGMAFVVILLSLDWHGFHSALRMDSTWLL